MELIGIIRVSTDEQTGKDGEGLDRQRASLASLGVAPDKIVEVSGVSGSDLADTPAWKDRILPALARGASLCADALDRVVRADAFDLRTLAAVKTAGGKIILPGRTYDTTDHRDVLTLTIFAGIGGYDKAELVRRAQAGKEEARKRGQWVGRLDALPIGCTYDRATRRWGAAPAKAPLVLDAFRRVADGASTSEAARVLDLTVAGTRNVLRNPIYRGILTYSEKRGAKYASKDGRQPGRKKIARPEDQVIEVRVYGLEGQEPQLVPDAIWNAVQGRLRERVTTRRKNKTVVADAMPFSGYLHPAGAAIPVVGIATFGFEGVDGDADRHVMYGRTGAKSKGYAVTYQCRCNDDPTLPRCKAPRLPADLTNRALDIYLTKVTNDPSVLATIEADLEARKGTDDGATRRESLTTQLRELEVRERRLTDLFLDGRLDRAEHDLRQDKLRETRKDAQSHLDQLGKVVAAPSPDDLQAMARTWAWNPDWTVPDKRKWLAKHCPSIRVDAKGVRGIVLRLPCPPSDDLATPWSWTGSPIGAASWKELLGEPLTRDGRLRARGITTAGEVCRLLGIGTNRLGYLLRSGRLPQPTGKWGKRAAWTPEDIAATKAAWEAGAGEDRRYSAPA